MANLLPVSGFTTSDILEGLKLLAYQISACGFLLIYQISSKSDHTRQSYDVIAIFKMAACWIWFRVMVAHRRSESCGLCFILNWLDRIYSFGNRAVFIFWHFDLKLHIRAHFRGFWGHISPNYVIHRSKPPKGTSLRGNTLFETWSVIIDLTVRPERVPEKKRTGLDSQKVAMAFISPGWGEDPHRTDLHQNLCGGCHPHVINCAKAWTEIFRGYDFTGGRISRFPIDSFIRLTTVQRYCAACDVHIRAYSKYGNWPHATFCTVIKLLAIIRLSYFPYRVFS